MILVTGVCMVLMAPQCISFYLEEFVVLQRCEWFSRQESLGFITVCGFRKSNFRGSYGRSKRCASIFLKAGEYGSHGRRVCGFRDKSAWFSWQY